MDKGKEIEEMAKICGHSCEMWSGEECAINVDCAKCGIAKKMSEELYNAGYRKVDNVRRNGESE